MQAERKDPDEEDAGRLLVEHPDPSRRGLRPRCLLGEVTARGDSPEDAGCRYREPLALAEELGMQRLAAHSHFGLAHLYRRTDKPERAGEHVATVTSMFREMGMPFWLEKAEAP